MLRSHVQPATPTRRRRPLAAVALLCALLATGCGDLVEVRPLRPLELDRPARPTTIVDADGERLAELADDGLGLPVPLSRVAPVVADAVIAVEDTRFREHRGIDARALGRALVRNVRSGEIVEGGSTITQQLAKNTVTGADRTLERKLAEAGIAWQLEEELSKDEILERYLNAAYFGSGAHGIEAAAVEYFGVNASQLTLEQAALLAGMLRSPARYDPRRHPDAARTRRDLVLVRMRDQQRVSAGAARAALEAPLGVIPPRRHRSWRAAYFVDHVLSEIERDPAFDVLGTTPRERARRLFAGGLRVETTLDPTWQQAAEEALGATLTRPDDPDGAMVGLDPATGAIRALVGGRDYFADDDAARFNLATDARRQPGSTFKAVVLAAALADGVTLDETFSAPPRIRLDPVPGERGPWTVTNHGGRDFGTVDLTTATAWSVNVVYAQLIDRIGARRVARLARRMGVRSPLRAYRALALGAQEVSVLDMATVQATLAGGGVHRRPVAVERILDGDTVLWERPDDTGRRVLDQSVALRVTATLKGVVEQGTGVRADARRPLAGKTGTTQDDADAWFAGYTPDLAAAVWIGYHERRIPMVPPRTPTTVEGGTWPAEAFARFTLAALGDVPANDFTVRIPEVGGSAVGPARRRLKEAGFDVTVEERYSASLPPGLVLAQEPRPGREVALPIGYRTTLTVSTTTPEHVTVPDVLGMDLAAAADRLRTVGLVPQRSQSCPGGTPTCTGAVERSGQVWESAPAVGATVSTGDRVLLRAFPTP